MPFAQEFPLSLALMDDIVLQTARFFYFFYSFVGRLVICLENLLVRGFFFFFHKPFRVTSLRKPSVLKVLTWNGCGSLLSCL